MSLVQVCVEDNWNIFTNRKYERESKRREKMHQKYFLLARHKSNTINTQQDKNKHKIQRLSTCSTVRKFLDGY